MRTALDLAILACLTAGIAACERTGNAPPLEDPVPTAGPPVGLPDALLLRFESARGSGFSREGWEVEVLQMGSDVRVRGALRAAGTYVPVFHAMTPEEFHEFWLWADALPLDGFRVVESPDAPDEGWRKRLKYDAVLGRSKRELCENEWTRAPRDAPWLEPLEQKLHQMVLDYAGENFGEAGTEPLGEGEAEAAVQRALEALEEAVPESVSATGP